MADEQNGALVIRSDHPVASNPMQQPIMTYSDGSVMPAGNGHQPMMLDSQYPAMVPQGNTTNASWGIWDNPQLIQGLAVQSFGQVWNGMHQLNDVVLHLQNQIAGLNAAHNEKDAELARLGHENGRLQTQLVVKTREMAALRFDVEKHSTDKANLQNSVAEKNKELAQQKEELHKISQGKRHALGMHDRRSPKLRQESERAKLLEKRIENLNAALHETVQKAEEQARQHVIRDESNQARLAEVEALYKDAHAKLQIANAQVADLLTQLKNAWQEVAGLPGGLIQPVAQPSDTDAAHAIDPGHIDFTPHAKGLETGGLQTSDAAMTEMQTLLDEKVALASECGRLSSDLAQYIDMDARMERTRKNNEILRKDLVVVRRELRRQQETEQIRHAEHVAALTKMQQRYEELAAEHRRSN